MGDGPQTPVASGSASLGNRMESPGQQRVIAADALATDGGGAKAQDPRVDRQWGVNVEGNSSYDTDSLPFFEQYEDAEALDYFSRYEHDNGFDNVPNDVYGPRPEEANSDWGKLGSDGDAGSLTSSDTSGNDGTPAGTVNYSFEDSSGSDSASDDDGSWDTVEGRNEEVLGGDEGAAALPSEVMSNVDIIDSDGVIHEEGAAALQSDDVAEAITRTGAHYDSDYITSIGNKIVDLRAEHGGSVNLHDADVASEFTTREKEILANWQLTGSDVGEFTDSNGQFMQATVMREGVDSVSDVADEFDQTGELLFATHSNKRVSDCIDNLQNVSDGGVDIDELSDKLHQRQSVSQVVSVKREAGNSVEKQVNQIRDNISYNTSGGHTADAISNVDRDISFSDDEVEVVAKGVNETINREKMINEFTGRVAEVLGFRNDHGFDFGKKDATAEGTASSGDLRSVIPSEGVIIAGRKTRDIEQSSTDSSKLSIGVNEDGKIMNRQKNQQPVDVMPDELNRVVKFDVETNANGIEEITNVSVESIGDVSKASPTMKYTGDVSEHVDSEDGVPDEVDVVTVGDDQFADPGVRNGEGTDVSSLDETNDPPSKASTVETEVVADRMDEKVNQSGAVGKMLLVNTSDASGNKAMGDDGELIVLDAVSDEFELNDVDASDLGEGEENQFPDIARAGLEVKLSQVKNADTVSMGQSQDPASKEPLTEEDSLSAPPDQSEDGQWAANNATPANTRYVKIFYDQGVDSNITSADGETAAKAVDRFTDRQPNKRGELFEDGEDGYQKWKKEYESNSGGGGNIHEYLADDADEAVASIETVVIGSGEDISDGKDGTDVKRDYVVDLDDNAYGRENESLDQYS